MLSGFGGASAYVSIHVEYPLLGRIAKGGLLWSVSCSKSVHMPTNSTNGVTFFPHLGGWEARTSVQGPPISSTFFVQHSGLQLINQEIREGSRLLPCTLRKNNP